MTSSGAGTTTPDLGPRRLRGRGRDLRRRQRRHLGRMGRRDPGKRPRPLSGPSPAPFRTGRSRLVSRPPGTQPFLVAGDPGRYSRQQFGRPDQRRRPVHRLPVVFDPPAGPAKAATTGLPPGHADRGDRTDLPATELHGHPRPSSRRARRSAPTATGSPSSRSRRWTRSSDTDTFDQRRLRPGFRRRNDDLVNGPAALPELSPTPSPTDPVISADGSRVAFDSVATNSGPRAATARSTCATSTATTPSSRPARPESPGRSATSLLDPDQSAATAPSSPSTAARPTSTRPTPTRTGDIFLRNLTTAQPTTIWRATASPGDTPRPTTTTRPTSVPTAR